MVKDSFFRTREHRKIIAKLLRSSGLKFYKAGTAVGLKDETFRIKQITPTLVKTEATFDLLITAKEDAPSIHDEAKAEVWFNKKDLVKEINRHKKARFKWAEIKNVKHKVTWKR